MPVWTHAASDVVVAMQRKRIRRMRRRDGIDVDNQYAAGEILIEEAKLLEMRHSGFLLERKKRLGLHMQVQIMPVAIIFPRFDAVLGPQALRVFAADGDNVNCVHGFLGVVGHWRMIIEVARDDTPTGQSLRYACYLPFWA